MRQPNVNVAGDPIEYILLDKPDDLASTPHGRQRVYWPDDTTLDWYRFPVGVKPDDFDDGDILDGQGDLRSFHMMARQLTRTYQSMTCLLN